VHPSQVADVMRRHPQVHRARLVVSGEMANDVMTLLCEVDQPQDSDMAAGIVASIREVTKLRGEVSLVAPGTLPNDGRVIEDARKFE
jgi:phenylacetate-CoA ligase